MPTDSRILFYSVGVHVSTTNPLTISINLKLNCKLGLKDYQYRFFSPAHSAVAKIGVFFTQNQRGKVCFKACAVNMVDEPSSGFFKYYW